MDTLRYPIGRFEEKTQVTSEDIGSWIRQIADAPEELREAVKGLTTDQMNLPYRPDGWRLREVVHHLADAHMNAYIRFKLALTETNPVIKPFQENLWVLLSDYDKVPAETSLTLLDALHARWAALLQSMELTDFNRTFVHPETGQAPLARTLQLYAWHGRHHIAHITSFRERMGW
ncbi:YfiT family bacillithiol transferase [Alicyclobacillus dauci]|uniref:Putative metal-dependent hydrolase NZD86_06615 n=1 Tax=Alicyclobacillus dauci TaxID=1475485 RepID=A0ABY6Z5W3_9BACL|nr:putative metal-dependent hydrolase [Alicyclobacillus dauci]WAH38154.1 putative metal-dependent hydrolase [Alicyclobacillus dauci]